MSISRNGNYATPWVQPVSRSALNTVLLVHHGRPHFEVVLALTESLRSFYKVSLWSNFLHVFGRRPLLSLLDIGLYDESTEYSHVIIISGDQGPSEKEVPAALWSLLSKGRVTRVLHRFNGSRKPGEIYLFSRAELPFVPVSTGLSFPKEPPHQRRQMLIQGNIENRRNYDLVTALAGKNANIDIRLCGIRVKADLGNGVNIFQHSNLDELEFHRLCASADFIMPMVDPIRYAGYFKDRFTSSIQVGFAYSLPFIAHKALFDLYPIVGFSYQTDEEFFACVSQAAALDADKLALLQDKMSANRAALAQTNGDNITTILTTTPFLGS